VTSISHVDMQQWRGLIRVDGDVDLANVAELTAEVRSALEPNPALLLIDLRGCEFIDLSVIAALAEIQGGLDGAGSTDLAVVARRGPRRVLRLTGTDELMPVLESMVDALHTLDGARRDDMARASIPG
jgi:anti-anti-sigma factor